MHCFWFRRNILDLQDNVEDVVAKNFIDKIGPKLDKKAIRLLENLKSKEISNVLPSKNIISYDVKWEQGSGINPNTSKEHKDYLESLCKDFYQLLKDSIDSAIKDRYVPIRNKDVIFKECSLWGAVVDDIAMIKYMF